MGNKMLQRTYVKATEDEVQHIILKSIHIFE